MSQTIAYLAELEHDLIGLRTKEALAVKKQQGKTLGKPKGTIQKSKFDTDLERIKDLLKLGLSVRKIAPFLATTTILHSTRTSTNASSVSKAYRSLWL